MLFVLDYIFINDNEHLNVSCVHIKVSSHARKIITPMKISYPNRNNVSETDQFEKFQEDFDQNIEFLEDFYGLITVSGRIISFVTPEKIHFVNPVLLNSSINTLKSIKLCCSIGSFSDANTLIRKLRDDLLLYAYILSVLNKYKPFAQNSIEQISLENEKEFAKTFSNLEFNTNLSNDEKAIESWLKNEVHKLDDNIKKKLSFGNYMNVLKSNPEVKIILEKYNLKNYWALLTGKLNDYVHNNGQKFNSHNIVHSETIQLDIYLSNINIRTSYVVTFFLILITMTESALLCSGEIEDYLNLGLEPPEDCQYEIAPFIQKFIDDKVVKLHPELKDYLRDNNNYKMKIQ